MKHLVKVSVISLLLFAGCVSVQSKLLVSRPANVETIPKTIGVYPLLTAPVSRKPNYQPPQYKPYSKIESGKVYLSPPAGSELNVTPYSQMMTAYLSGQLVNHGFDLREIPVEVLEGNNDGENSKSAFVISVALLRELQQNVGLQAILVGNVYFVKDPQNSVEKNVAALYVKLIDIETLNVLCQVVMPFDPYGFNMQAVAAGIAEKLDQLKTR